MIKYYVKNLPSHITSSPVLQEFVGTASSVQPSDQVLSEMTDRRAFWHTLVQNYNEINTNKQ